MMCARTYEEKASILAEYKADRERREAGSMIRRMADEYHAHTYGKELEHE